MKKKSHKFYQAMANRVLLVAAVFFFCYLFASSTEHKTNTVTNMNGVKSIEAIHIITKYDNRNKTLLVKEVSNMEEAALYGASMPISFTGQLTAYNPVCTGCTGKVYCPPRQDVTNGNIYFEDSSYGSVRILAADYAIPCGTIVEITNVSFSSEPIIGIVLDRGGAITGNIMDFLVTENDDMNIIGRQKNVHYQVLRWGW
jgi:3D (Asp-Asp-Asp) domain-containing protein